MKNIRLKDKGKINRKNKIHFYWNGKKYYGFEGDSLASALLVNNIKIIGRSFKYHRPRGIMSSGVDESGGLVTIGKNEYKDPNVIATTQELYEGLNAFDQNAFPNVNYDLGSVNNLFNRFFAAGFYYKTFMGLPPFEWGKGTKIWMFYEKFIRRAAGMGKASLKPDPDSYEHSHDFCDVLIIGSGPSGIQAALKAAEMNLDVILVEQDSSLGGSQLSDSNYNSENDFNNLINKGVKIKLRTVAFGLYDSNVTGLLEKVTDHLSKPSKNLPRQRFWTIRPKKIILATGALERIIAFGNNDKPGVMTVSAAKSYLNRFGILLGKKLIIFTNNDSAYSTASELSKAGASVKLFDARSNVSNDLSGQTLKDNVAIKMNTVPLKINGFNTVKKLETAIFENGNLKKGTIEDCDYVLLSGGWSPVIHLLSHKGIKPTWNEENSCFIAGKTPNEISVIGSAAGIWNHNDCIESGKNIFDKKENFKLGGWKNKILPIYEVKIPNYKTKNFIDFQHDVTTDDLRLALQEGFVSVEHLKRYTTLGMANDQGKVGNVIGIAIMANYLNKKINEVGTTTFRPPYKPISIGALAGRNVGKHFRPLRKSAIHDWNISKGAVMIEAGLWQRPWYYPKEGETLSDAYIRETEITRKSVGICDVTSLGKISIQGPDSTEFINRVYSNAFAKLQVGKARYGIMLRDDGIVMDDGTCWRISENEYFMTTSTAQAGRVMSWLEELLQIRWNKLKVHVTTVSEQWCGVSIGGPKSRECISKCVINKNLIDNENLPFMGVIETKLINEIPCRIARISFSGEMGFEIYVPSDFGNSMMDLLWKEAKDLDGCLYVLEALGALRIEKGHITGAELDGRVTIEDVGLGKMASTKKSYIGSAMKNRGVLNEQNREKLVGFFPVDKSKTFDAGSLICEEDKLKGFGIGRITSVTHSPEFGHWIGLGFIAGGYNSWKDKTVIATDPIRNNNVKVKVVKSHMLDPEGKRMHG